MSTQRGHHHVHLALTTTVKVKKGIIMMPLTSQSIRNLLEIKDPNINFFEDSYFEFVDDVEVTNHKKHTREWLPEHLSFDEFKSVGSLVSFIWADSNSHNIGEILYRRTSRHLARYFSGFSDSARRNVKTVSLDLNAGYINLVPQLFPNADIVVDRFHIIQMCTRALNKIRVQVMKSLNQRDKKYRFMKQEWKQFLRPFNQLEMSTPKYHYSVGYYETDLNLVTECLELDEGFKAAYDTYQEILEAFHIRLTKNRK